MYIKEILQIQKLIKRIDKQITQNKSYGTPARFPDNQEVYVCDRASSYSCFFLSI